MDYQIAFDGERGYSSFSVEEYDYFEITDAKSSTFVYYYRDADCFVVRRTEYDEISPG